MDTLFSLLEKDKANFLTKALTTNSINTIMIKTYILSIFIFSILLIGCNFKHPDDKSTKINIQWVENIPGDFSFHTQWSYSEGIFRNEFGQLVCDGLCPEESYTMIDSSGKIYADSIQKYYHIVDTTHQYYSIQCEAWCYEWAGTNFIKAKQTTNKINCNTLTTSGTHCQLIFDIEENICTPRIELNSIASPGTKIYYCTKGFIKINKDLWKQKIIKAEFNFDFKNSDNPDKPMFWKGKIYTEF